MDIVILVTCLMAVLFPSIDLYLHHQVINKNNEDIFVINMARKWQMPNFPLLIH